MSDTEAEEEYETESDYFPENEAESEEIEEEDETEDLDEEDEIENDVDDIVDNVEEPKKEKKEIIIKKINEKDKNHIIIKIIPKHERKSSHIIQFSEMVESIGIRISQIDFGSPVFTDVTGLTNSTDMAKKEFFDRKNPLIIERKMKVSDEVIEVEEWAVREMTFPV